MLRRGRRPKWMIDIAKERMNVLFSLAEKEFTQYPSRSHRYAALARKISTKYNAKIPLKWNHRFCKKCYKFLKPGKNSYVRLVNEEIHIKCKECNNIMKIPYKKEKKIKRRAKIESHIVKKGANE